MKFTIEWGDYDVMSGSIISSDINIEIVNKALKQTNRIVDAVNQTLKNENLHEYFNVSFNAASQYELVLKVEENGKSSHIELNQDIVDSIVSDMTDYLSSWVDTPYVDEYDNIVSPDFSEIKVSKT